MMANRPPRKSAQAFCGIPETIRASPVMAYEGSHASFNGETDMVLAPPPPDSLEDLWGATEQHNAFLDLRRIPTSGEWLKAPLLSQPLGYAPMTADWTQVLDAMVFTRTMRPSTRVE
jgi:erythromycin esterase-like protein